MRNIAETLCLQGAGATAGLKVVKLLLERLSLPFALAGSTGSFTIG